MKNNAIIGFIIVFLLFVSGESLNLYFKEHSNYKRMEGNLKASNEQAEYYKTRSGEMASKVTAQELTIREMKNTIPAVVQDLKNLYIRPGSLQSFTKANAELKKEIRTPVRDSIVYLSDSSKFRAKSIKYRDKWFSVSGIVLQDSALLSIGARDTIRAVIFSQRKHPFWWILSKKQTKTVVTNANPWNKIIVEQSIVLKN